MNFGTEPEDVVPIFFVTPTDLTTIKLGNLFHQNPVS